MLTSVSKLQKCCKSAQRCLDSRQTSSNDANSEHRQMVELPAYVVHDRLGCGLWGVPSVLMYECVSDCHSITGAVTYWAALCCLCLHEFYNIQALRFSSVVERNTGIRFSGLQGFRV